MLRKTYNSRDPFGVFYRHLLLADGDGGESGGDGGSGGSGGAGDNGGEGTPPKPPEKSVPQSEVDRILKERLAENTRKSQEDLAKALGVPLEEAKNIIKAHNDRVESEKTEAQKAKDAAEAAKAASDAAEAAAKTARHEANLERRLTRALPKDLEDEILDKRVAKLAKLIEVEEGASLEDIDKAITALKADWSELFGTTSGGAGAGGSDPSGKPNKTKSTDAYKRGAERAKAMAGRSTYGFENSDQGR